MQIALCWAQSRRLLRTPPSSARQPMISLPAFVACEPGRVDAARGSIAVARRDALGLIWSSRSRLHCLFSRAFVPPREQVGQMELRSQYAGLFSGQHAMAVVAFNGEVD